MNRRWALSLRTQYRSLSRPSGHKTALQCRSPTGKSTELLVLVRDGGCGRGGGCGYGRGRDVVEQFTQYRPGKAKG